MFSTITLLLVLKYSCQRVGCFCLIKSKTLTVSSVSNNAECAPADSKPFNLAKDSSFIDLFPLGFNSVFKTSSSIANAALTIFKAS